MAILTLDNYFSLHGRPADRDLITNATETVAKVNRLLEHTPREWGVWPNDQISGNPCASGYRPPEINARTSNAATRSTHLRCLGVDVQDWQDRRFAVWCCNNVELLIAYELWMEDPRWTGGKTLTDPWGHLQTVAPASGRRIYQPSTAAPQDPLFFKRTGARLP